MLCFPPLGRVALPLLLARSRGIISFITLDGRWRRRRTQSVWDNFCIVGVLWWFIDSRRGVGG